MNASTEVSATHSRGWLLRITTLTSASQLVTAQLGHHHIRNQQMGAKLQHSLERLLAVLGFDDLDAECVQQHRDQLDHVELVCLTAKLPPE
jgi:hypothetical protein